MRKSKEEEKEKGEEGEGDGEGVASRSHVDWNRPRSGWKHGYRTMNYHPARSESQGEICTEGPRTIYIIWSC